MPDRGSGRATRSLPHALPTRSDHAGRAAGLPARQSTDLPGADDCEPHVGASVRLQPRPRMGPVRERRASAWRPLVRPPRRALVAAVAVRVIATPAEPAAPPLAIVEARQRHAAPARGRARGARVSEAAPSRAAAGGRAPRGGRVAGSNPSLGTRIRFFAQLSLRRRRSKR